jgi:hypothetical protein
MAGVKRFRGEVRAGHKGLAAVEVPFDPTGGVSAPADGKRSRGRKATADAHAESGKRPAEGRGQAVTATINGTEVETAIVARSRKHWLLVPASVGAAAGEEVAVSLSLPAPAPKKPRSLGSPASLERLRKICLALPETSEKISHGAPAWFVSGKLFATWTDNHHNDGRVAIWCAASDGAQDALVGADPETFFVPPYVGGRGWVGVRLDRKLPWPAIASIVADAWRHVAPKRVLSSRP